MTKTLIKYLLPLFKHQKYPGALSIAEKLLNDGKCIVAGTELIWKGGVGNFIHIEPAQGAINCSLYILDSNFLDALFVKNHLKVIKEEIDQDILNLKNELSIKENDLLQIKNYII